MSLRNQTDYIGMMKNETIKQYNKRRLKLVNATWHLKQFLLNQ